jgi:ubiquinone/menaquinone biosynthesis C-methylase UbiE
MSKEAAAERHGQLGEQRFSGKLSDDYPLWRLARPFLDEVHDIVAGELRNFTRTRKPPLHALDIGMGGGAIAKLLLHDAKLDVVGVDNEPKMLEQARKGLSAALASGRLKIALDDALQFLAGQPPQSIDVIASGYVLHNLTADYRDRLYGEIWRVLAPSGILINADKYAQEGEAHRQALRWQLGLFFDVLGSHEKYDTLREWVLHYAEDEAGDRVMPEAEAMARLERLGFTSVAIVYRRYMDAVLVARKPGA